MSGQQRWYRMHDAPDASKAAIEIQPSEAKRWNTPELGFGIFVTVNSFDGPRRREHLTKINAWAVDMDDGTKAVQHKRILSSPLIPSLVIETKRGFQVYWLAREARAEHWNAIVLERLVPYFGADKNARDLCRIMRAPGSLHLKDPADPFRCRIAWQHAVFYTERQVAEAFTWIPDKKAHDAALAEAARAVAVEGREAARRGAVASGMVVTETLWEAVYNLDCQDGLGRLSGHWSVGGETYTFRATTRGNRNLFVNGRGSSVFIDTNGRIGSMQGGGPTLTAWLRWFGHPWRVVLDVLFEIYPHLRDVDEAAKKNKRAA